MTNGENANIQESSELSRQAFDVNRLAMQVSFSTEALSRLIVPNIALNNITRLQNSLVQPFTILPPDDIKLHAAIEAILRQHTTTLSDAIRAAMQVALPVPQLEKLRTIFEFEHQLEDVSKATGWLPHLNVPFIELLSEAKGDSEQFADLVRAYYDEHEEEIIENIAERLAEYSVDEGDKEILQESISVHQSGFFRSACLGVLPLIEKVIREDWLRLPIGRSGRYQKIKDAIGDQPTRDFIIDGKHEWVIALYILKGLYESVDPSNLQDVQLSSMPNRHAASHGLANYNTKKPSFNAIICADYILRVTSYWSSTPLV